MHLPTILPGGIVLDPHDRHAQQLQAHAQRLGLDPLHVMRARLVGQPDTYLVMQWPRPVFQHPSAAVVAAHLDSMAQAQLEKCTDMC